MGASSMQVDVGAESDEFLSLLKGITSTLTEAEIGFKQPSSAESTEFDDVSWAVNPETEQTTPKKTPSQAQESGKGSIDIGDLISGESVIDVGIENTALPAVATPQQSFVNFLSTLQEKIQSYINLYEDFTANNNSAKLIELKVQEKNLLDLLQDSNMEIAALSVKIQVVNDQEDLSGKLAVVEKNLTNKTQIKLHAIDAVRDTIVSYKDKVLAQAIQRHRDRYSSSFYSNRWLGRVIKRFSGWRNGIGKKESEFATLEKLEGELAVIDRNLVDGNIEKANTNIEAIKGRLKDFTGKQQDGIYHALEGLVSNRDYIETAWEAANRRKLESAIQASQRDNERLQKKLLQAEADKVQITENLEEQTCKNQTLISEIGELRSRLEADTSEDKRRVRELEGENAGLLKDLDASRQGNAQLCDEISGLTSQVTELNEQSATHQRETAEKDLQITLYQQQLTRLRAEPEISDPITPLEIETAAQATPVNLRSPGDETPVATGSPRVVQAKVRRTRSRQVSIAAPTTASGNPSALNSSLLAAMRDNISELEKEKAKLEGAVKEKIATVGILEGKVASLEGQLRTNKIIPLTEPAPDQGVKKVGLTQRALSFAARSAQTYKEGVLETKISSQEEEIGLLKGQVQASKEEAEQLTLQLQGVTQASRLIQSSAKLYKNRTNEFLLFKPPYKGRRHSVSLPISTEESRTDVPVSTSKTI